MRFIYGKQDFNTMERGQENCYLLTNGLGGFSSASMIGSVSRNDHSFFMACTKAPNHRVNMIHRLSEKLFIGETLYPLSSQEFENQPPQNGWVNLSKFSFEDVPVWTYQVQGIEIKKTIGMKQLENSVAVSYEISSCSQKKSRLEIQPFMQFVKKGEDLKKDQTFLFQKEQEQYRIASGDLELYLQTNGIVEEIPTKEESYFYSYDVCDGRRSTGSAASNHKISIEILPGTEIYLSVVYFMGKNSEDAAEMIQGTKDYRKSLDTAAGFTLPAAKMLAKSASQFISRRESTGGDTILAGYPFFEDWGRDTMIALPGCCISTGQHESAKSILYTFMKYEHKGLMPNLFPEGGNQPLYNTVDAALLFINAVYLYYEKTLDQAFVKDAWPVMKNIISGYQTGTDFGIHMDEDGLIMAGEGLDQVTWMDVRVGEILPTPRHGKPVEINAYWYNALRIMAEFSGLFQESKELYQQLSERVKDSFLREFWMEEKSCLKDVLSETGADNQIRCNQIWAVSLPFTMLEKEKEGQVVKTVFEKLYTPYGLRTLDMEDKEFHPFYGGEQLERDMAYHQGTVWTFPLGAFYIAWLKVHHYSKEAAEHVKEQLEGLECAMREGCIGQLPEIYDGKNPTRSKGCFAQAWSVGEILRVYDVIEHQCC